MGTDLSQLAKRFIVDTDNCKMRCKVLGTCSSGRVMINTARPASPGSLYHGELRPLSTLTVKKKRQRNLRENKYFVRAQNKFGPGRLPKGVLPSVAISGDERERPHTKLHNLQNFFFADKSIHTQEPTTIMIITSRAATS